MTWGEDEGFEEEEDGSGCPYGFEFCEDPQLQQMGTCEQDCDLYLCSVEADADGGTETWKCQVCGCTDTAPCVTFLPGAAIETCHWTRRNLCSKCAQKQKDQVQENMDKSISKHVAFTRDFITISSHSLALSLEIHMKDFPKIRDPCNLKYIDQLNYVTDAQMWEKKIRDLIEFDKEHGRDIPNPTDAGDRGGPLK